MLAGVDLAVCGVLSSVELNDSHLYTGLGGVCGVFHGVTGSGLNEACSMLETWWILGVYVMIPLQYDVMKSLCYDILTF